MQHLKNRQLRETLYTAYVTRASDLGPDASKWDNKAVMQKMLEIRLEMAKLVGFSTYAEYALQTKMAKTPDEVLRFLEDLLARSRSIAKAEYQELKDFAKQIDNIETFNAWDNAYYSEKLQEKKFHFIQEDIRPYFPIKKVLSGMFTIMNKVYGLNIRVKKIFVVGRKTFSFFTIYDSDNTLRGGLYIDLYARPHKRDGAWMDDCQMRHSVAR